MTVTDDDKRFAGTLIDGARMYSAAADAVNDKLPNALHVLSHLLGMSTELALKAYLKNNGFSTSELRKLGHTSVLYMKKHRSSAWPILVVEILALIYLTQENK